MWQYLAGGRERLEQYVDAIMEDELKINSNRKLILPISPAEDGFFDLCCGQMCYLSDRASASCCNSITHRYHNARLIGISPTAHVKRE